MEIEPGLRINHASAPAFLALKWAAFHDRGANDPFRSEDLEDILALLVSRDGIVTEVVTGPIELLAYVQEGLSWLRNSPDYEDLVAACLGGFANTSAEIARILNDRIGTILAA